MFRKAITQPIGSQKSSTEQEERRSTAQPKSAPISNMPFGALINNVTTPPQASAPVQAKLTIGQPNDKYEQEADAVAASVVQQINAPPIQQQEQSQEMAQAKFEIVAPTIQCQSQPVTSSSNFVIQRHNFGTKGLGIGLAQASEVMTRQGINYKATVEEQAQNKGVTWAQIEARAAEEGTVENVKFIKRCSGYDTNPKYKEMIAIYDKYIAEDGARYVNLPYRVSNSIAQRIEAQRNAPRANRQALSGIFNEAQIEIGKLCMQIVRRIASDNSNISGAVG